MLVEARLYVIKTHPPGFLLLFIFLISQDHFFKNLIQTIEFCTKIIC